MHRKIVMKLGTENNIETFLSALISLKLPIRRTVIKVPATRLDFPAHTEGAWFDEAD